METSPPPFEPTLAPTPVPRGERPGHVTAAAVLLIAFGVLVTLLGVLFLVVGATFESIIGMPEFRDQLPDVSEAAGGLFVAVGALFGSDGVAQLVAGIFILAGRTWARITGLVMAVLGVLVALVGVLPGEAGGGVSVIFVILVAAYVYISWVLASNGRWFAGR